MPTFTETKALVESSNTDIKAVETAINRNHALGSGYAAVIRYDTRRATVRVLLSGPKTDINRMPEGVIIKYAQVLNKVRKWINDQEPDFPTL